ncbi:recombinase family protein [Streptomyces sp. NBC_00006]|uniref:recombinase family protein n=1 Tax=Streptomyces sp. NBC_00006 TaxID=2975619 RepID=UPI002252FEA3|nr:recombinase family protein [Streptomyces sp. NBC_00006]MCX5537704.1 recombinase family protein [Streptomyces sp. NBC_00006]MCX5537885.1 recombinase family protein [Streptomyces sp. NBC_00006]
MATDPHILVEQHDCPMSTCEAPAGSPCRTTKGRVAIQYHTARFRLVSQLKKELGIPTPAIRKPGQRWEQLPTPATAKPAGAAGSVRLGYARASTARQSLDYQLDALNDADVTRIFSEKVSTRVKTRPELGKAIDFARELRTTGLDVTLVVHEHKRLGRGSDLVTLAETLKEYGIRLEFLTGELRGEHDPSGPMFAFCAAMSGMEREYIRERTLDGHETARKNGKTIGGAGVTDDDMLGMALHLRDQNLSLRDIAAKLVITTGKKKGQHPSPATVMRMLRDHDEAAALAG